MCFHKVNKNAEKNLLIKDAYIMMMSLCVKVKWLTLAVLYFSLGFFNLSYICQSRYCISRPWKEEINFLVYSITNFSFFFCRAFFF